jgi:hypothetical protein
VEAYRGRWSPLDVTHWQTRIKNSHHQILKLYPEGCLLWLKEHEPAKMAALKASVEEIKRTYADRDSQGLDAALNSYWDSHMETFKAYLATPHLPLETQTPG